MRYCGRLVSLTKPGRRLLGGEPHYKLHRIGRRKGLQNVVHAPAKSLDATSDQVQEGGSSQ